MNRRLFKIVPGSWQAFIRDQEHELFHAQVQYLELFPDDIYLGAWDHRPTPQEVAEVVRVVTESL